MAGQGKPPRRACSVGLALDGIVACGLLQCFSSRVRQHSCTARAQAPLCLSAICRHRSAPAPATCPPARRRQGTLSTKKKKQKKIKRMVAAVKRAERREEGGRQESFAALQLLHDPQVGPARAGGHRGASQVILRKR